jgi:hypothetical protein
VIIAHGKTQVSKWEFTLFTIEQSGYPSLLGFINSHHNNFAFIKVDFHARKEFEAKQDELEIDQTLLGVLNQNHCVFGILQVGHSPWNQMWDYSLNMTSHSGSNQDRRQCISNKIKQQWGDWVTLAHPLLLRKYGPTSPLIEIAVWPPETNYISRWMKAGSNHLASKTSLKNC